MGLDRATGAVVSDTWRPETIRALFEAMTTPVQGQLGRTSARKTAAGLSEVRTRRSSVTSLGKPGPRPGRPATFVMSPLGTPVGDDLQML
jgi:hypothetical protein